MCSRDFLVDKNNWTPRRRVCMGYVRYGPHRAPRIDAAFITIIRCLQLRSTRTSPMPRNSNRQF